MGARQSSVLPSGTKGGQLGRLDWPQSDRGQLAARAPDHHSGRPDPFEFVLEYSGTCAFLSFFNFPYKNYHTHTHTKPNSFKNRSAQGYSSIASRALENQMKISMFPNIKQLLLNGTGKTEKGILDFLITKPVKGVVNATTKLWEGRTEWRDHFLMSGPNMPDSPDYFIKLQKTIRIQERDFSGFK